MTANWDALLSELRKTASLVVDGVEPQSGRMLRLRSNHGPLFVKTAPLDKADRLTAEAEGLAALRAADAVRVPDVIAVGTTDDDAYLAIEWLDLRQSSGNVDRLFGEQLAILHRVTAAAHGWHRDNTIGLTRQVNTRHPGWLQFYSECRLMFQADLAARNGYEREMSELRERLLPALPELLGDHDPQPSLLHGDLWSGNYACCDDQPVIYDPAVYFGDRETDLAMTRLFGGFSASFYRAYEETWPLPLGHERRLPLYQLYHVLNHLNLFGRGYLQQAQTLVRRLGS